MTNNGAGAAVIKSSTISRGNQIIDNMPKLFKFSVVPIWDDFFKFGSTTILKPGEEVNLILITRANLAKQGISKDKAEEILSSFDKQKQGIRIKIEYEDVFGNLQQPLIVEW